jgi:hypothetical protein
MNSAEQVTTGAADAFESVAMIVDSSNMQRELKFKEDSYEARDTVRVD